MCVLCVQGIDDCLEELASPNISDGRRRYLEGRVQGHKDEIQSCKVRIAEHEQTIKNESRALSSKQGEPAGLLCQLLTMLVAMAELGRYGSHVAMVTNN